MSDFPLCRLTLLIFYSFYFSYTLLFHIPPRISCSNLWLAQRLAFLSTLACSTHSLEVVN